MTHILILPFETDDEPSAVVDMLQEADPLPIMDVPAVWWPQLPTWEDGSAIDSASLALILTDIGYYPCIANEQASVVSMPDWWIP